MAKTSLTVTPTYNQNLPLNTEVFASLTAALDYAARGTTGVNFYSSLGVLHTTLTYTQLRLMALQTACYLHHLGLNPGDRIGLIAQTHIEFIVVFFACQYSGLIPCPMPHSIYMGGKDPYQQKVLAMFAHSGAKILIAPYQIAPLFTSLESDQALLTYEEIQQGRTDMAPYQSTYVAKNDAPAYIQFSSGSTAEPKGILISQHAVCQNIHAIVHHGMAVTAEDRAFSWLPFYHDMGLVGFILAPIASQRSVDYLSPSAFARRPSLWFELMSKNRTSITYAPLFGYQLALQRIKTLTDLNLTALRIAGIGGDMINAQQLSELMNILAPTQLSAHAFLPSYGMAEATLAISMAKPGMPLVIHTLTTERDAHKHQLATKKVVSCGFPLPGITVRILDEQRQALPERSIGEIWIKGPSISALIESNTVPNHNIQGFIATGDLGYYAQGQLFITGRIKDLIIIRGRNIWAQDVEWIVMQQQPSIQHGDIAAFEAEGGEKLIVVIQSRGQISLEHKPLILAVQTAINQGIGVEAKIVIVAPNSLPRTSSGKLMRSQIKTRYEQQQLIIV